MRRLGLVLLLAIAVHMAAQSNPPLLRQKSQGTLLGNSPAQGTSQPATPGSKVELNPQPLPPTGGRAMKLRSGAVTAGPAVKNSRIQSTAMAATLQAQRQSAEQEASQMKLGIKSPASSIGNRASSGVRMPNTSGVGPVGPGQVMSSSGGVGGAMPPNQIGSMPILCGQDPSMRIVRVSGKSSPATFTPDSRFNFYTIAGCSFGDPGPNAKVYIYLQNTFHQDFVVQEWSDNAIKLNLDPTLTGLLDQDNLTLVVQRADGKQAVKTGFKFYAARETKLLSKVLQQDWSLQHFTTNDVSKLTSQYFSPSEHGTSLGFPSGWSAAVSWTLGSTPIQSNEDVYNFKDLAPGFEAESAQAAQIDIDCDRPQWMQRAGKFDLSWDEKGYLHVRWQAQACTNQMQGVMGTKGDAFYIAGANYVVKVWGSGPRGIDPWSGKPLPAGSH